MATCCARAYPQARRSSFNSGAEMGSRPTAATPRHDAPGPTRPWYLQVHWARADNRVCGCVRPHRARAGRYAAALACEISRSAVDRGGAPGTEARSMRRAEQTPPATSWQRSCRAAKHLDSSADPPVPAATACNRLAVDTQSPRMPGLSCCPADPSDQAGPGTGRSFAVYDGRRRRLRHRR